MTDARMSTLNRGILVAIAATALTVVALVITVGPVSAYSLHGCEYDNDSIDPISYRFFSVDSAYETAFKDAEAAWDATTAPGYFKEQSWSVDPEINVVDGEYSGSWWAQVVWRCDGDGTYDGNEVELQFDTGDMSDLSAKEKKLVAEHEIGHAYGLGHVFSGCHVMRQGEYKFTCSGSLPSSDDVAGVEEVYE